MKLSAGSRLNLGQTVNRKLSCRVPQLVPRPHYYSARPERLGSRGPNEDPGSRTRGRNQEQANMAEKSVVLVRIQVNPSKGKRTIKKGA